MQPYSDNKIFHRLFTGCRYNIENKQKRLNFYFDCVQTTSNKLKNKHLKPSTRI